MGGEQDGNANGGRDAGVSDAASEGVSGGGGAGPRNLVFISDGTLSTLLPGHESNAGILYRLLIEVGRRPNQQFDYDHGVQSVKWRRWLNAITGEGINRSIRRGYQFLARGYRPGDRIYLMGYSRGAYAVRSLAGMIGSVGLLRQGAATERNIRRAFRLYERIGEPGLAPHLAEVVRQNCHAGVAIDMLGVWDTVKALGLPYPVLSRMGQMATEFHNHPLGPHIRRGYHALAIDEDRAAFAPILWQRSKHWEGRLEQVWFPGVHGDVGGDVGERSEARPLANIALNWMLREAEQHGLILPAEWQARFPEGPAAPSITNRTGVARLFLFRRPRVVGCADGESIQPSVRERMRDLPGYLPRAQNLMPDSAAVEWITPEAQKA